MYHGNRCVLKYGEDDSWEAIWKTNNKIKYTIKSECRKIDCSAVDQVEIILVRFLMIFIVFDMFKFQVLIPESWLVCCVNCISQ
jgi:hypothetical protein